MFCTTLAVPSVSLALEHDVMDPFHEDCFVDLNLGSIHALAQSKVITANFPKQPRPEPILCDGDPNGEEFQLLLTGEFDGRYTIEATTNLAPAAPAWEPLATLTNTFGTAQFNDPAPTTRPQRFCRAVAP